MRYVIAFAMVVSVWLLNAITTPSPPIVAKEVPTEGIHSRRQDDGTFRVRWASVADMPPMRETVYEPLLLVSMEGDASNGGARASGVRGAKYEIEARTLSPSMLTRPARYSRDVCARHHMHRVTVRHGRWTGWRCRR